jgi:pyruvate,orthophosphate dikinase
VRIATEMAGAKIITTDEALLMVKAKALEQCLHPIFVLDASSDEYSSKVVAKGLPASPGAAVGAIVFTASDAAEYKAKGTPCILVREETSAEDVGGVSSFVMCPRLLE